MSRLPSALFSVVLLLLCTQAPARADSVRDILERRGVLGKWAEFCDKPVSPTNDYTVYRAVDAERVQRDVMHGPNKRVYVGFVEAVVELSPNELQMTVPQLVNTVANTKHLFVARARYEGRLGRLMAATLDGKVIVADGRYAPNLPNRAWRNKPTTWMSKCD